MSEICPKCHRPLNLGNSPNLQECHGGDFDDDQQCELSAKIYKLKLERDSLADKIEDMSVEISALQLEARQN